MRSGNKHFTKETTHPVHSQKCDMLTSMTITVHLELEHSEAEVYSCPTLSHFHVQLHFGAQLSHRRVSHDQAMLSGYGSCHSCETTSCGGLHFFGIVLAFDYEISIPNCHFDLNHK